MQISLRNSAASLDEPVCQSRLAVVDMGDNAEVSNVVHGIVLAGNGVKQQEATGKH